jgi:NAD(P)-dependent dehydrogenase (short-subunit alcohol dehydrogenase family)
MRPTHRLLARLGDAMDLERGFAIKGSVCVVTGGASGIGRCLANELSHRDAAAVIVADIDLDHGNEVADRIGGRFVQCDVAEGGAIESLVETVRSMFGRIDVFCSNAGYSDHAMGDLSTSMEDYERLTRVNLLAHVAAAKAVVPEMVKRGSGYLLQTLSSAALIAGPASAGYTFTKHGAIGFAEWLAVNYSSAGVHVSCLCPNAVYTSMFGRPKAMDVPIELPSAGLVGEMLLPEDVATQSCDAMEGEAPFLILPHPRVGQSFRRKAEDYDGWITKTAQRLERIRTTDFERHNLE